MRFRGLLLPALLLVTLLLAACSAPPRPERSAALAGRGAESATDTATRALGQAEEGHGGHEEHGAGTQGVNLFLGGSSEGGERNGFTFGVDYEYRVLDDIGVGAFAEGITGLNRAMALGGEVYWHAWKELVLTAGVGAELKDHDQGNGATWDPIVRLGAFYEIPLNDEGWVVSPAFAYDFTEGEDVVIYGLNMGYVF